jgi:hypothetical protein
MAGKAIGIKMDLGYPGSFSRNGDCVISARPVDKGASEPIGFGDLTALNADNSVIKLPAAEINAAKILGIALREAKQFQHVGQTEGYYEPGEACDVLERGTVAVVLEGGTPAAGGAVYFNATSRKITAVSTSNIAWPNAVFTTGKVDSNNIVEITIKNRR